MDSDNKVTGFLADIQSSSPAQYQILLAIRALFVAVDKSLVESIKYGELVGGIFIGHRPLVKTMHFSARL